MDIDKIFFVAGASGMAGSAITSELIKKGYKKILTPSHAELDLLDKNKVDEYLKIHKPDYIILCAAKVGGILANKNYPADFIYENISIQTNVIHSAYKNGIKNLMFLGSSCVYPKFANQPIKEDELLSGKLEETNEPYAIAKIAGIKMCYSFKKQFGVNFLSVMPTNLFGINDNFNVNNSHLMAALLRKVHEVKIGKTDSVILWGSGEPRREFMHTEDFAEACIFLIQNGVDEDLINIGTGKDIKVYDLCKKIMDILEVKCDIKHDLDMPDGTPRKLLDIKKLSSYGWEPKSNFSDRILQYYNESPFRNE